MQQLIAGIHHFQQTTFPAQREQFARLAAGQSPLALFVTCSDARIVPSLLTQTAPGELFVLRNAGNLIPHHDVSPGSGEAATIEFAVAGLGVQDVIVCGHSHCGAMKALLDPTQAAELPAMRAWLVHAAETGRIMADRYGDLPEEQQVMAAVQANVLVQLEHLRTHPVVAEWLATERLRLHGWVYRIETGDVFAYDRELEQFRPLAVPSEDGQHATSPLPQLPIHGPGVGQQFPH